MHEKQFRSRPGIIPGGSAGQVGADVPEALRSGELGSKKAARLASRAKDGDTFGDFSFIFR